MGDWWSLPGAVKCATGLASGDGYNFATYTNRKPGGGSGLTM